MSALEGAREKVGLVLVYRAISRNSPRSSPRSSSCPARGRAGQAAAPLGVRANCVAPSAVDTEALRQVYGEKTEEILAAAAAASPSGRNVTHDDYCSLIEYLASPSAAMIQGQVVFVTGGEYLAA